VRKPFGPFSLPRPRRSRVGHRAGEEVEPDVVGLSRDDVEGIWHAVEAVYRMGLHPALQVCIRCRDQPVLHRAIGYARGNDPDDPPQAQKTPVSLDTPLILCSASTAVTAFLVLKLDEVSTLHPEDRVADYTPSSPVTERT
jgi:CubicO group peptidase (beta-lactamase class C family)